MLYGLSSTLPHDSLYGGVMKRRYDPDAVAWFAAMPTQPSATVKAILNTFVAGLKTDSLWSLIDGGNVLALGTMGQCLVDFKVPSRVATTAASPTIDFIPYRGASGTAALTAADTDRIDTGFIPSSAGGGYAQNSAQISVYSVDSAQSGAVDLGANGTAQFYYRTRSALDATIGTCNNVTANTRANGITDGSGFFTVSRTGAAQIGAYRDGSLVANTAHASTGNPDASIRYLQVQGLAGNLRRLAFACYGQGLSAGDVALLNTRVQTLVSSLATIDSYDTDAAAWFAAMPTQPISRVKVILNDFIMGLKADDLWGLIDGGAIRCLETSGQALVDFKTPSRVWTVTGSPTFTSYRGYTGTGAVESLNSGFIPSSAGGVWSLDSCHLGLFLNTSAGGTAINCGANGVNDTYIRAYNAGNMTTRVNDATNATTAVASGVGFSLLSRTESSGYAVYKNGTLVGSPAIASVGLPNAQVQSLGVGSASALDQESAIVFGGGLDATQAAALSARVNTAVTALTVL